MTDLRTMFAINRLPDIDRRLVDTTDEFDWQLEEICSGLFSNHVTPSSDRMVMQYQTCRAPHAVHIVVDGSVKYTVTQK